MLVSKKIEPKQELYQSQKIYLEDLVVGKNIENYEKKLKTFLSKYGNLIDIKVLKNGNFIS